MTTRGRPDERRRGTASSVRRRGGAHAEKKTVVCDSVRTRTIGDVAIADRSKRRALLSTVVCVRPRGFAELGVCVCVCLCVVWAPMRVSSFYVCFIVV